MSKKEKTEDTPPPVAVQQRKRIKTLVAEHGLDTKAERWKVGAAAAANKWDEYTQITDDEFIAAIVAATTVVIR